MMAATLYITNSPIRPSHQSGLHFNFSQLVPGCTKRKFGTRTRVEEGADLSRPRDGAVAGREAKGRLVAGPRRPSKV